MFSTSKTFNRSRGRAASHSAAGKVFTAYATVTAPVIFSTAAGTGGPLLWNPTGSGKNAILMAVGVGISVVSTVAGARGQTAAPGSTTAIDKVGNALMGSAVTPACTAYRVGTPTNAGTTFTAFMAIGTGALTVEYANFMWFDLDGTFVVPPGAWAAVAGSATLTTLQAGISLVWTEQTI